MRVWEDAGTGTGTGPDEPPATDLRFTLLGQLQVLKDGADHAPTAPKVLQLMGLLLLQPGRVVPLGTVVDELWGDRPPRSARHTVQTYVWQLRRCIERYGLAPDADRMLITRPPGYLLAVDAAQVDVLRFQRLVRSGRELLARDRADEAAAVLRAADDLCTGQPLANVDCGPVLSGAVIDLQEQRRDARHLRIEAEMRRGAHRELIGELRLLAARERLDEVVHRQLMEVLAASGRRGEALGTYQDLRRRLVDELGVEPSADLRRRHLSLLSGDGAAQPSAVA